MAEAVDAEAAFFSTCGSSPTAAARLRQPAAQKAG